MDKISDGLKVLYSLLGSIPLRLFLIAFALFYVSWKIDSWYLHQRLISYCNYFLCNFSSIFFPLAMGIFFVGLVIFILSAILYPYVKQLWYRYKYPIRYLENKFFLINFAGTVYLLDNCTKEIRWVENWETASELGFNGYWTPIPKTLYECYNLHPVFPTSLGKQINLKDFHWGNGIKTRGAPGT